MKVSSVVISILFLVGCTSATEDGIKAKWLMYRVIQDGQDVTSEHDPMDERYIIFRSDGSFESGGEPAGTNTGRYVYNAADRTLFLDSDAGPEDDSHWKVEIQGDTMHWQGFGSKWALQFELIHLKDSN